MIATARHNAARMDLGPRVRFEGGDTLKLEGFRTSERDPTGAVVPCRG
jgi:hypothetical protein